MQKLLINGAWVGNESNEFPVINPANGEVVDTVVNGDNDDVNRAVAAAAEAFLNQEWRENAALRSRVLYKWADLLEADIDNLAVLLTKENGKLVSEAKVELRGAVEALRFCAGQARTLEGRSLTLGPNLYGQVVAEPVGVVAVIVPWNWPVLLMMRELAPALAAGNTVVVKPASYTPLTCMRVLGLTQHIDEMPKGVVNAVMGGGSVIGNSLVAHDEVKAVSFTGSTEVGEKIGALAAKGIKKVVLELGGKAPSVIFKDADLDKALPVLVRNMFVTAGQNCMAVTRVLIQDEIYEEVRDRIVDLASRIKVGSGLDPNTNMGPVISETQLESIDAIVKEGIASGAELLLGGKRLTEGDLTKGYFYAPTVFSGASLQAPIVQKEIFGPVVSLEIFHDEDEACHMANATTYGLVASVWTANHDRAQRLARKIEAGTVWINTYMRTFPEAESGGMKKSGLGRSRGKAGIYEYMEWKHIFAEISAK